MPRARRVCSTPGCPELTTDAGRCVDHARQADKQRGTRQQRGLDAEYDRARTQALTNATHCATCGTPFTPDNPATGGHVKARRNGGHTRDGIQAQCRPCNYGWRRTGN